jgi:hypothetical protein
MVSEEPDSLFYDNLCQLIEGTERTMRSTTHKYAPLQEDVINYVEGAFYANLIRLYQNNLNDKFFRVVKMSSKDRGELMDLLRPFFKKARDTAESSYNKGEVTFHLYQEFRSTLYDFGDDVYWLLLGVERYAEIIRCEHRIIQFKNEVSSLLR